MKGTQHLSYDGSIDRFDSLNLGSYKSMIYPLFQRLLHIIFLFHSHLRIIPYLFVLHPDTPAEPADWNEY
jgi:hypothetical protein